MSAQQPQANPLAPYLGPGHSWNLLNGLCDYCGYNVVSLPAVAACQAAPQANPAPSVGHHLYNWHAGSGVYLCDYCGHWSKTQVSQGGCPGPKVAPVMPTPPATPTTGINTASAFNYG